MDVNNQLHPTVTLATYFIKPVGKKIHVSNLYTTQRQFAITPKGNFQYQLTLIRLIKKNRLAMNDANMKNKTQRKYF